MKGKACALLCLGVAVGLQAQEPARMGGIAERLRAQDVQRIAALTTSPKDMVWLLEGMGSQVLPERWHVEAYLLPDSNGAQVRRGRVLQVSSLITNGSASEWRRDGAARYAQVRIAGRPFGRTPSVLDLDRPFLLDDEFTDAELSSIVSFVRSSPKQSKRLPDGTLYSIGLDVDGALPIVEIRRQTGGDPMAILSRSPGVGQTVVLHAVGRRWTIVEVGYWVA